MAKIHHATAARAKKVGIELVYDDGDFIAMKGLEKLGSSPSASAALAQAEAALLYQVEAAKGEIEPQSVGAAKAPKGKGSLADAKAAKKAAKAPAKAPAKASTFEEDERDDEDEDEDAAEEGRSIVKRKYREAYKPHHMTCGDDFAAQLSEHIQEIDEAGETRTSPALLRKVAQLNNVWNPAYASKNVGMQRMNVGNRLRAIIRKGGEVVWPK